MQCTSPSIAFEITFSTISGDFEDINSLAKAVYLFTEPFGLPAGFKGFMPFSKVGLPRFFLDSAIRLRVELSRGVFYHKYFF
jgi:hypothetical protein